MTVALGMVVAVAAGIRSTWSPCGLSMLSTLTSMGERGRGRRFAPTARWYTLGGVLGGVSTGLVAGAIGWAARMAGLDARGGVAVAAVGALVAATSDCLPRGLPIHRRQVNERWLDVYRPWVYGTGFGWQTGSGVATYIMTAGVYAVVIFGAATGSVLGGVVVGATFGTVRGAMVWMGAGVETTEDLRRRFARFIALGVPAAEVTVATLVVSAAVGLGLSVSSWAGGGVLVAGVVGVPWIRRGLRTRGSCVVAAPTPLRT